MARKLTKLEEYELENKLLDVLAEYDMDLHKVLRELDILRHTVKRILGQHVTTKVLVMENRPQYLQDPQFYVGRLSHPESGQNSSEQRPSTQDNSEPAPDQKA